MSARLLNEATARSEICRTGGSLLARGYLHATAGNLSARLADVFLNTQGDNCLLSLDTARPGP